MVIYPEGTRYTKSSSEKSRKYAESQGMVINCTCKIYLSDEKENLSKILEHSLQNYSTICVEKSSNYQLHYCVICVQKVN